MIQKYQIFLLSERAKHLITVYANDVIIGNGMVSFLIGTEIQYASPVSVTTFKMVDDKKKITADAAKAANSVIIL